jgi:hypothetical protein
LMELLARSVFPVSSLWLNNTRQKPQYELQLK